MRGVLNLLHHWMDARHLDAHFFGRCRDYERQYSRFWRYRQALPARGEIGVFAGGYGLGLLAGRLTGESDAEEAAQRLEHARRVEQTLVDDGVLLLKIWLHLPPAKRRKRLAKARKSPNTVRLDDIDLELHSPKHVNRTGSTDAVVCFVAIHARGRTHFLGRTHRHRPALDGDAGAEVIARVGVRGLDVGPL
jgi:Polyphosphate kinase 2 (PPK2)